MTKRAMMQATQVMIAIQIEGDREADLVSLIRILTQVITFLFSAWQRVSRVRRQWRGFCQDCRQAVKLTVFDLVSLGFKPVVFGVG